MNRKDFLDRDDLSDEQFVAELGVDGELADDCCWLREEIAGYGKISGTKIYPGDDTREYAGILDSFDTLEFHMKAEERFQTEIKDSAAPELFPLMTLFGMRIKGEPTTFGEWCVRFGKCIEEGRRK